MFDFTMPFFIQLNYWFDLTPGALSGFFQSVVFGVFAVLIILVIILRIIERRSKADRFAVRLFNSLAQLGIVVGCLGFLFLFFGFEAIPFFGAKFWYLFLGLIFYTIKVKLKIYAM